MKQLLSDGYYDFSDCDFQPMMFVEKYKFDEGKSKPYFCQGSLIQFYAPNDVFNCPLNINRAEVQAEFGDEKMIYLICQMRNFDRLSMNWRILLCFA